MEGALKTLTLKVTIDLDLKLVNAAKKKGVSKSEIARKALASYFMREGESSSSSFLAMAEDLAGCVTGASDLSVNKAYLDNYGG